MLQRPTLSCSAASNPGPRPIAAMLLLLHADYLAIRWLRAFLYSLLKDSSASKACAVLQCSANAKTMKQPITHVVHSCCYERLTTSPSASVG